MKTIDLEKSSLDELKSAAFDILRQINIMQKQLEVLNSSIEKKEKGEAVNDSKPKDK